MLFCAVEIIPFEQHIALSAIVKRGFRVQIEEAIEVIISDTTDLVFGGWGSGRCGDKVCVVFEADRRVIVIALDLC